MHNQRGLSLLSLVFFGIFVILGLLYARPFFVIPYTTYKVGGIMSSVLRDGGTESEMKKIFDERVQFERILEVVSSKNLTVAKGDTGVQLTTQYEHCVPLWTTWTVCAQITVTR